jgi:hypothetical protein
LPPDLGELPFPAMYQDNQFARVSQDIDEYNCKK